MRSKDLSMNQYQTQCMETCLPTALNYEYLIAGLAAEAGEVAGHYAKQVRSGNTINSPEMREKLMKECGDVLWFVAVLCEHMGYDLADVAGINMAKLQDRIKRGKIQGSGDER